MQFAVKRKTSHSAPYLPRASGRGFHLPRRNRVQVVAIACVAFFGIIWLFTRAGSSHGAPADYIPKGRPPAVIVTVEDPTKFGNRYTELVRENRKLYAEKHGYQTFFPHVGEYDLKGAPMSWTKVVAMRHAMTKFPDATYFWYVDPDTFIMNPHLSVEKDLMESSKLEERMIVDHPVVPPDSIIHTFSHLKGQDIDFVLTQDNEGLVISSFVVRNTEWTKYLFETWFDPIYRSYNFQKAETHALEHIVQWHPTILSKLALVPQRTINAYNKADKGNQYETGDIAVRFPKCAKGAKPTCEADSEQYVPVWRAAYRNP